VSPTPPDALRAMASIPTEERMYATSLRWMRSFHLGMERKSARQVTNQKRKKPHIWEEVRADEAGMWFGSRAMEGKIEWRRM
jgi:hypothetical protein